MLLIITNKTDYTADFLILELLKRGIKFYRFNTEDFPMEIELSVEFNVSSELNGYFVIYGKRILFSEIGSIWYRRPLPSVFGEQFFDPVSQSFIATESRYTLDSVWRILPCFWISHPDKIRAAEAKLHQLITAFQVGLAVPNTMITTIPEQARIFYRIHNKEIIYKPQRHIQIDNDQHTDLIYTSKVDDRKAEYFDEVRFVPSLFQNNVPKSSELRITVIGDNVLTVQIHSQDNPNSMHDWRRANSTELKHTPFELPNEIAKKCVALVRSYGLAFGAIDMILTPDGEYVFLELNPNGQWAWIEQICPEILIRETLINLLIHNDKAL